jgi:L-Ala-D/L-Glu epimerase
MTMKIERIETTIVSVPYRHREVSSQVQRDGVTDVLIKVVTSDGVIGWGEATSGADAASVEQAIHAMTPFLVGRSPWDADALRAQVYHRGLWNFRPMTANFAWAGIDMALWDIRGKAVGLPAYMLLGGRRRSIVDYFYYLARGGRDDLAQQCRMGLDAGFSVFYLKIGIDIDADLAMVAAVRAALGSRPRIRLDANAAWKPADALIHLRRLVQYDIDFVEQPIPESPMAGMAELRSRSPIPLCANEGLWTEADAYARITRRAADVFCFSPYWVGSLTAFQRLAHVAEREGFEVCKHSHGELGVAAAAVHQVLLTIPNLRDGNQHTAHVMAHDVLAEPLPIATSPTWGTTDEPGLGIRIDEDAVSTGAARYRADGQYLPYESSVTVGDPF